METEIDEGKAAFLKGLQLMRVATISSQGDPFVVPVRFYFDGKAIYFTSAKDLPLITNLRANRRVALVAEMARGDALEGLVIQGLAQLVRGQGEYSSVLEALEEKYPGSLASKGEALVKVIPVRVLDLSGGEP